MLAASTFSHPIKSPHETDLAEEELAEIVYTLVYSMRFSWDARKSEANFKARGFDFEFATLIFDGPTLERDDTRHEYGERRVVAVGRADGMHLTVVYTDRPVGPEALERRIISARLSDRGERRAYAEAYPERTQPGPSEA